MFCPECGKEIGTGGNFCPECGSRIESSAKTSPSYNISKTLNHPSHTGGGGYIEQNLMAGEEVVYRTKLHWVVFLWPAIFLFIALLGSTSGSGKVGGFFFLLTILTGVFSFITYSTSEFGVTNKRVLIKLGFIRRHSLETLLTKIEGISVDQGILGRMLGYGTVVISGTGGTKEPFHRIDAPLDFRKRVQEQIAAIQESR